MRDTNKQPQVKKKVKEEKKVQIPCTKWQYANVKNVHFKILLLAAVEKKALTTRRFRSLVD